MKLLVNEKEDTYVKLSFLPEADGDVVLRATKGGITAELLRITTKGELVRISGQKDKLLDMGFKTSRRTSTSSEVVYVD